MTSERTNSPLRSFAVFGTDGNFSRKGVARDPQAQTRPGETVFVGVASPQEKRVVDGELRTIPQEIRDNRSRQEKWQRIRQRRAGLFRAQIDSLNPIRWEALDEAQKQAWRSYRQALRDLPQTFSNPEDVIWPTPPEERDIS